MICRAPSDTVAHKLCYLCQRLFVCFVFAATLLGCKPALPDGILSEREMERVLYDYHIAQGMAESAPLDGQRSMDVRRYELQEAVFRKHGITRADFDSSMVFYCSDIDRLSRIYDHLSARFERETEALGAAIDAADIYAGLSAEGDTANVWTGRQLYAVHNRLGEHLQTWLVPCDSTWLAGDDILWRFSYNLFSRENGVSALYASVIVTYANDSIRAKTLNVISRSNTEIRIDNPEGWVPRQILGHFYTPSDNDAQRAGIYVINRLSLIRFHKSQEWRDRILADTLAADSSHNATEPIQAPEGRTIGALTDSTNHRRSPSEFRQQQDVEQKINIVKEKPYTIRRKSRGSTTKQHRRTSP